jgi:hypothetical protein
VSPSRVGPRTSKQCNSRRAVNSVTVKGSAEECSMPGAALVLLVVKRLVTALLGRLPRLSRIVCRRRLPAQRGTQCAVACGGSSGSSSTAAQAARRTERAVRSLPARCRRTAPHPSAPVCLPRDPDPVTLTSPWPHRHEPRSMNEANPLGHPGDPPALPVQPATCRGQGVAVRADSLASSLRADGRSPPAARCSL